MSSADPPPTPFVSVTSGDPTSAELAALVTVIAVRLAAADGTPPVARRSQWGAHTRKLRGIHRHGPGAWRASGRPR